MVDDELYYKHIETLIEEAINNAKQNEVLFKKTVEGLRKEYIRLQQDEEAQQANELAAKQEAAYNQFATSISNEIRGLNSFAGQELELSDEELQAVMQEFSKQLEVKQKAKMEADMAKQKAEAAKNLEAGNKFLEENKTKEGVKVTESGLQYKVIELGKGTEKPTATSTVKAKYKGTTIDGKVFDESKDAVAFPLNGVIRGWTEGLQLFPEGSKFELYIPANLGYGEHSPSPAIPANSVLIFEIELVEIVKPEAAK